MAADQAMPDRGELATSLQNLSRLLTDAGRLEEALDSARKAVELYRQLQDGTPAHRSDLAGGLQALSLALAALRRDEEALSVSEEAIALYQDLAAADPALYRGDLANLMNNRLGILDAAGRSSDALEEAQEAVSSLRRSADENPDRYIPDLAKALNNLSNRLASAQEEQKALLTVEEAVAALRRSANHNPSRYARDLAAGLSNLSLRLSEAGHDEEALAAHEEALSILEREAERDPASYGAELTLALSNQSILLDKMGRPEEAIVAAGRAVERWRSALRDTDDVGPDLAMALNNFSIVLDDAGRAEEAIGAALEASSLFRMLASQEADRFSPHLSLALSNLSKSLTSAERYDEAAFALEEAIDIRRQMISADAGNELAVQLAGTLNDLSGLLSILGRDEEAIARGREGLARYRELAAVEPQRFVPDLARTLSNMALTLERLGKHEEAADLIEETLAGFEDSPLRGVLELARSVWLTNSEDIRGAVLSGCHALHALEELESKGHAAQARSFLRSLRELAPGVFEGAWREATGRELPVWLRYPGEDPELRELLVEWLSTETWEASREFLEGHSASLLSDRAEAQMRHMVDQQPDQSELARHLGMLIEARGFGIGAAFSKVLDAVGGRMRREQLNVWLWLEPDESLDYLREHRDALLDPRTAADLVLEALKQPEEPSLWARVGLLNLCRSEGIESGATLFERELHGELSSAGPIKVPDRERELDVARIRAGLNRRSAEHQFRHALTAAESEQAREADQAIFRCRSLLASWDVPDYTHRLDELIAASDQSGGDLERLREGLAERPADFRS